MELPSIPLKVNHGEAPEAPSRLPKLQYRGSEKGIGLSRAALAFELYECR